MNERGFVTIFALCMILVIALAVKGIQESETNHNYETKDLQTEFDLQNAADGGIYEASELVRDNLEQIRINPKLKELLPSSNVPTLRKNNQRQLLTRTIETDSGTINVTVWGERLKIQGYTPDYSSDSSRSSYPVTEDGNPKYGYILFSVATTENERRGKIYRRAFAYVIDGHGMDSLGRTVDAEVADKDVVHFMEITPVEYRKK